MREESTETRKRLRQDYDRQKKTSTDDKETSQARADVAHPEAQLVNQSQSVDQRSSDAT